MNIVYSIIDKLYAYRLKKSAYLRTERAPKQVACWDCNLTHTLPENLKQALVSAEDFFYRHAGHQVNWFEREGMAGLWHPNADIKESFQNVQTMTVTNLHSLASSATIGWQSAVVDNSTGLYLDALVMIVIDFPNLAPAGSRIVIVYTYGGIESGTYTYPASGSEGTITLTDIDNNPTVMKRIGTLPYLVQDATEQGGPYNVAAGHGGMMPSYWGAVIMNRSGQTFAASGNSVKYRSSFLTVI